MDGIELYKKEAADVKQVELGAKALADQVGKVTERMYGAQAHLLSLKGMHESYRTQRDSLIKTMDDVAEELKR